MTRLLITACALACSLSAGIPANFVFSSETGANMIIEGAGAFGNLRFDIGGLQIPIARITSTNAPYNPLLNAAIGIYGTATINNLTGAPGPLQNALVSGLQTFAIQTSGGGLLLADLDWQTIQSIDLGGPALNLLNTGLGFNVTNFSVTPGTNSAENAALTALASTAPGRLTLSTTTSYPLSYLLFDGRTTNIGAFSMEFVTATPEPSFYVAVMLFGAGLFAARPRWQPAGASR